LIKLAKQISYWTGRYSIYKRKVMGTAHPSLSIAIYNGMYLFLVIISCEVCVLNESKLESFFLSWLSFSGLMYFKISFWWFYASGFGMIVEIELPTIFLWPNSRENPFYVARIFPTSFGITLTMVTQEFSANKSASLKVDSYFELFYFICNFFFILY
jgi:hypothetical protein